MRYRIAIVMVATLVVVSGCSQEEAEPVTKNETSIQVGGLYATQDEDGSWRVMKVLALDDFAVHLRSYANKFPEQPTDVDPEKLSLGGLDDSAGFGIGHFPLAREGFFNDNPVLIKVEPVIEEELEGYKIYLEAMNEGR